MRLRYVVLDVFTDKPYAGNALAVFPEGDGLTTQQMQAIAKEMNLSETTFVQRPTKPGAAARVRIFTPSEELPYAGHPSVGTHWLLAEEGRHAGPADGRVRVVQEVGAGLLPIDVERRGGRVATVLSTQVAPRFGEPVEDPRLASILGLTPDDVGLPGLPPRIVNTGIDWLVVPVDSEAALRRVRLAGDAPERLRAMGLGPFVYPFCFEGFEKDALTAARGIIAGQFEDPVTGSASGCLGAYLWKHARLPEEGWFVHTQGHVMGRPGRVRVEVAPDGTPRVGGSCVRVLEGHLVAL